jgi:hypothetical protein
LLGCLDMVVTLSSIFLSPALKKWLFFISDDFSL